MSSKKYLKFGFVNRKKNIFKFLFTNKPKKPVYICKKSLVPTNVYAYRFHILVYDFDNDYLFYINASN